MFLWSFTDFKSSFELRCKGGLNKQFNFEIIVYIFSTWSIGVTRGPSTEAMAIPIKQEGEMLNALLGFTLNKNKCQLNKRKCLLRLPTIFMYRNWLQGQSLKAGMHNHKCVVLLSGWLVTPLPPPLFQRFWWILTHFFQFYIENCLSSCWYSYRSLLAVFHALSSILFSGEWRQNGWLKI